MKALRIVGILIGVVVLVLVIGAAALLIFVDPNDYKDQITRAVEEQTGRTLTIEGDMELSVFPWLGLEIGKTRLSNAKGFAEQPFAAVEEVGVQVRLLPLLRKELQMSTLRLKGLDLYLGVDKQGNPNWSDMIKPAAEPAPEADEGRGAALAGLAIGGVEISDANLVWDDQQAGARYRLRDLDLSLSEIAPETPIDFKLDFEVELDQPQMEGELELAGVLTLGPELQRFEIRDFKLETEAEGETLPGGKVEAELASAVTVDLSAGTLQVADLVLEAMGLKITGQASGQDIQSDQARFSGNLKLQEFVPRDLIQRLGQPAPEVSDATVLGKADAAIGFSATSKGFNADQLTLRLDDSTLTGSAGVASFAAQAIRFDLTLDQIDLDRYLPPPAEGEVQAAPTPAQAAAGGAGALPLDTLRALNLDGTLRINQLKAYQLRSSDVLVTVKARDGLVRVNPARASMYQGGYSGDITLDARGDTARIALDEKVQGVQAGPLLKDLMGDDKLLGTADVNAKLTASGNTPEALKRSLNGNAGFSFTEGAVKGINVAALIRNAKARLEGKPAPADSGPNQTDFTSLTGTAKITNGVVRNDDLAAMSPLLRINGEGMADLPQEQVDYRLTVKLVGSLEGQGGEGLQDLRGVAIPLRIEGPFAKPNYSVDLAKVLEGAAKEKVKEKVEEEVQKKLEDKLDDKVKDQLKGIFGR